MYIDINLKRDSKQIAEIKLTLIVAVILSVDLKSEILNLICNLILRFPMRFMSLYCLLITLTKREMQARTY